MIIYLYCCIKRLRRCALFLRRGHCVAAPGFRRLVSHHLYSHYSVHQYVYRQRQSTSGHQWSLYSPGIYAPANSTAAATCTTQHTVKLVDRICAKRFHRRSSGQPALLARCYRGTTTAVPPIRMYSMYSYSLCSYMYRCGATAAVSTRMNTLVCEHL